MLEYKNGYSCYIRKDYNDRTFSEFQGDDVLGIRGVGIDGAIAVGGIGIDADGAANAADDVVGITVGGSVHGVVISSPAGISGVLQPEGGGGSMDKISVREHEFVFIFSLS